MTIPTELLAVMLSAILGAVGYLIIKLHAMDTRLVRIETAVALAIRK